MNRIQRRDERKERYAGWFKDHQASLDEISPVSQQLIWSRPANRNYRVVYLSFPSTLIVRGDLESAIYEVSGPGGLEFWASCDIGYFAGKCIASPNGRGYNEWDRDSAEAYLDEISADNPPLRDRIKKFRARDSIGSSLEWSMFLGVAGHDVFGPEFYDYGRIGEVISDRCEAHLVGLKMAMAQLKVGANAS